MPVRHETKSSLLAQAAGPEIEEHLREAMILAICASHPGLVARFESQIEKIELHGEDHQMLRHLLLMHAHDDPPCDPDQLLSEAGVALENLLRLPHVQIAPPVTNRADAELAQMCLAEELAKLESRRGARAEIEDAERDLTGLVDEGLTWRLSRAAARLARAGFPEDEGGPAPGRGALPGRPGGGINPQCPAFAPAPRPS